VLAQQLAPFTADRDDLKVKILTERVDRYNDKLLALASVGQLPDVVAYDNPQALALIKGNSLYHLGRLQGANSRAFLQLFTSTSRSSRGSRSLRRSGAAPTGRGPTSWRRRPP
jgi:hypothetical protein